MTTQKNFVLVGCLQPVAAHIYPLILGQMRLLAKAGLLQIKLIG